MHVHEELVRLKLKLKIEKIWEAPPATDHDADAKTSAKLGLAQSRRSGGAEEINCCLLKDEAMVKGCKTALN